MGRMQASRGTMMLWAMFYWDTVAPAIHVDVTVTQTTYQSTAADHVHPLMKAVFPDGCDFFPQDNAP